MIFFPPTKQNPTTASPRVLLRRWVPTADFTAPSVGRWRFYSEAQWSRERRWIPQPAAVSTFFRLPHLYCCCSGTRETFRGTEETERGTRDKRESFGQIGFVCSCSVLCSDYYCCCVCFGIGRPADKQTRISHSTQHTRTRS